MSPPWGGPQYTKDELYDADTSLAGFGGLRRLMRAALGAVHASQPSSEPAAQRSKGLDMDVKSSAVSNFAAASITTDDAAAAAGDMTAVASRNNGMARRRGVAMFLPRQTDLRQLSAAAPEGTTLEVERAVLDGFVKGITVYLWLR